MNNFEMGFGNPLEENKNEEEKNNELTAEIFASLLEKVQNKKNPLNNEELEDHNELLEEFKNKEERELSSIEVKRPFVKNLRKTLLIITTVLVLSSTPIFAESPQNNQYDDQRIEFASENIIIGGLEINEELNIIKYTYTPKERITQTDYLKSSKKYNAFALGEFTRTLQNYYGINEVSFRMLNTNFINGEIVMDLNLDTFKSLNLNQNEKIAVETEKSNPKIEVESENKLFGNLEMINENKILRYTYLGDTHPDYETLINSLTEDIKTKLKFKTVTLCEFSIKMQDGKIVMETNFEDFHRANLEEMRAFLERGRG